MPSSATVPESGFTNPANTDSSVDLPAPFGPMMATKSPDSACSET